MHRIRLARLCLIVALVFTPLSSYAQGSAKLSARVDALEAAVLELQNSLNAESAARAAADTSLQMNITSEAAARMAADAWLLAQIDKLKGNVTATDLEGTYNFYSVLTHLGPGLDDVTNAISSYVVTGTVTLGTGEIGYMDVVASGQQLFEQIPSLNWVRTDFGGPVASAIPWRYLGGTVEIGVPFVPFGTISIRVTPAAGGQVLVGATGGPPGNRQIIVVLTRQP